jgi:hypothetical protein
VTGPQLASTPQTWTPLPEHWVEPGEQGPVQAPATHESLQATGVPQLPLSPHVCTPLPEHCVAPGTHMPVHAPSAHA